MDRNFSDVMDVLKSVFSFDIVSRFFFLGAIAVSTAIGIGLYHWVQEPIFTPLPYYISDNNLSSLIQELDKANITYRVNEYTHTISVPVSDVNKAKISLSLAGVSKEDTFSFAYLNDQNQLGNSQFLENARYVHALEADLARTIGAIQGINGAKVHLAIPQRNIFSDENNKPSASVVVNFTPGYENDKERVKAIGQIVAASVPGMEPSSVVITNQYGHYLSSILNQESLLNQEQLDYQNNLQIYYEKKIRSLLSPMLGINSSSISVNIDLDFTQQEEAKEEYDPDKTTLRSEQNVSESADSSGANGVPGSLSNQPSGSNNKNNSPSSGGGQSHTESIKNYEITKSMHYVKATSPKIKAISVAIIVDNEKVFDKKTKKMVTKPFPTNKLDQLTELIKSTIGFNKERGDRVTVINSSFLAEKIEAPGKTPFWEQPLFLEWSKQLVGILLGFVLLFIIYKKFISGFKAKSGKNLVLAANNGGTQEMLITPEMMQLKEEQIKVLKDLVAKDPNKVANIIKKWIAN